ncbi:MAG: hypothetical protein Q8O67_28725 [Deltaproteobacteria bacterium]|nr:hypothetical protein [Deltaproteobacteria bacterium]
MSDAEGVSAVSAAEPCAHAPIVFVCASVDDAYWRSAVQEVEIIGTFESEETARVVAKALNAFFTWLMEGDREADVPDFFGDFGLTTEDYVIDEGDIDWPEAPRARVRGPKIAITAETSQTVDTLSELTEALGAFDVYQVDDEEEADD